MVPRRATPLLLLALLLSSSVDSAPLMEDKVRLGSTPPSCRNRCNDCNPCMAVQVPTMPAVSPIGIDLSYGSFSNYKPLGWRCRCGNHIFNP